MCCDTYVRYVCLYWGENAPKLFQDSVSQGKDIIIHRNNMCFKCDCCHYELNLLCGLIIQDISVKIVNH